MNAARREFNSRRYEAEYAASQAPYPPYPAAYPPSGYENNGYLEQPQPALSAPRSAPAEKQSAKIDFGELRERAQTDGIRIKTAGSIGEKKKGASEAPAAVFNKGLTLFKAALITFCILLAESLVIFFVKDKIGVSGLYPAVGCGIGLAGFLLCTILYACGYRPQARRSKHPAYILNASILFVIGVIVVSMIAVYLKVDLKQPSELLKYVILPVVYLLDLVFFSVFYYLFSLAGKSAATQNQS